jgi:Integrase core domain
VYALPIRRACVAAWHSGQGKPTGTQRPTAASRDRATPGRRRPIGGSGSRFVDDPARVGYEWVHSLIDDHSRLAYSELHPDQHAATATGFVERGLAFYAGHGITPRRLLSDNAWTYTRNQSLAQLLADHDVRHLLIPPRRRTGILAAPLQRAPAPQLTQRTPTHQPRPQRPEAEHLDSAGWKVPSCLCARTVLEPG